MLIIFNYIDNDQEKYTLAMRGNYIVDFSLSLLKQYDYVRQYDSTTRTLKTA